MNFNKCLIYFSIHLNSSSDNNKWQTEREQLSAIISM